RLRGARVLLQRKLLPVWQLAVLRRTVSWLAFDLDDAVFLRDSYARRGLHDPGRQRRFAAVVRACDAVVAGNSFLADHASQWTDARPVHVIPPCVNPARYPIAAHRNARGEGPVRLAWIGSSSTLQGLERITPLLEELGEQLPGLE